MEDIISKIKDRLDIVEVVSEQVILKKSGNHYWGLCPFHKGKTPHSTYKLLECKKHSNLFTNVNLKGQD